MRDTSDANNLTGVETNGGAYIGGDAHANRDIAGRDIIYYGNEFASKRSLVDVNLDELFSQAVRLQIAGKLSEALEICKQIQAVNPYFPRVGTVIVAIEIEFKKGLEDHYVNMWGEIVSDGLFRSAHLVYIHSDNQHWLGFMILFQVG